MFKKLVSVIGATLIVAGLVYAATSTTNLSLRKPATTDKVNVETDLNENWDKIDTAYGGGSGTPIFATSAQVGKAGTDGQFKIYSEQGTTDYTVTLNPNATMTSAANFYLPADEPAGTYLLNMTAGGVIGYDSSTYLTSANFARDLVAGTGLTGGDNNVLYGSDADTTVALDLTAANVWTGIHSFEAPTNAIVLGKDAATNVAGSLKLWSAGSNNFSTTITSGTNGADITYTLPVNDGDNLQLLQTDGSGVLSWVAPPAVNLTTSTTTNLTGFIKGNGSVLSADNSTYYSSGALSGVTTLALSQGITQTPTVTGTLYDIALEDEWTGGTILNADYASGITQLANINGIVLDFNTNVTGNATKNIVGYQVKTPAFTQASSNTTTYTGFDLPIAGALIQQTNPGTITWKGINIQCPNTTATTATVNSYGIYVNGGTVTSGTQYPIFVNSGNIKLGGNIVFEGSTADTVTTTLAVVDPTSASKSINIPNADGVMAVSATAPATLSALGDIGVTVAKDLVTTSPLSGGTDNILPGADADITIAIDDIPYTLLADGTDGNLITWDADGHPALVATGSATEVLTSNGAGAAPTFQAAAGGGSFTLAFDNGDLTAGVIAVAHNLSSQYPHVTVYDNTNTMITPDSVVATSTTVSTIDLTSYGVLAGTHNQWHVEISK